MGFLGGSDGKESACNSGDLGSIHELGRSLGEGHGNPLQYSCLENPMEILEGYSPWGHTELDVTERLTLSFIYLFGLIFWFVFLKKPFGFSSQLCCC